MDPGVAVMILLIVVIVAALAVYLLATILELRKITAGLDIVIGGVGEIVAKSAPVNGVLDAINGTLVTGRDLLEGLLLKKAGPDSAGLVESLFPGEGANFLRRVGKSGKVINVGTVYTRGVGILASLGRGAPIGAAHLKGPAVRDPQYSTTAASMLYPRPGGDPRARPKSPVVGSGYGPKGGPRQYEPSSSPGVRPGREPAEPAGGGGGGGAPDMPTGRIGVREPEPAPEPAPSAPAAPSGGGGDAPAEDAPPSRLNVKGSRPWER